MASAVAIVLSVRPSGRLGPVLASVLLATLLGAYALSVTTGVPWLVGEPEPVDGVGIATKAVEVVGLLSALQLITTRGGRGSLRHKEAQQ